MSNAGDVRMWQSLSVHDVETMTRWLSAVGFVEHATYRDPSDESRVVHAEWLWPGGGGLMFGSHRDGNDLDKQPGTGAAYLVLEDVDRAYAAALEAGGRSLREPAEMDYGGRGASVTDPEGNTWSFGSYQPS